ncbi:MAG: hypothetical protein II823_02105 [Kiritimatiellae bacterium]|nr:hypothetical protein [Kiritimatiellia bacterium]
MQENLKHVSDLYETAVKAGLDLGCAASLSVDRLAELYNGCGPEWLPAQIRKKLTRLLAIFESAFLIHDTDFASSDGSTFAFAMANDRLEMNCLKLANYTYPWYSWRRYRARLAALEIASLCRRYGWKAYCAGCSDATAPKPASHDGRAVLGLTLALALLALTGCMRSIEVIKEGDDWRASYTSLGLKTDVDSIEVEKKSDGFIRVKVKGLVTDVSEENKKIVDSSGAAVGTIAEKVVEGVIEGAK